MPVPLLQGNSDSHKHGLSSLSGTLPVPVPGRPFQEDSSWLPREGEGTDLHGFEGGDEREHDVIARAARAGQQRAAPAEREQNRARLSRVGNSKDWL